jgi:solute carrier family 35, member E2
MFGIVFWMGSWYCCSLVTLFLNKIILSDLGGDVQTLGLVQMLTTATMGALKVYGGSMCSSSSSDTESKQKLKTSGFAVHSTPHFFRNMAFVGVMRGTTVILGLVSLSHVAVSFTETIKASAPLFTVVFARIMLEEKTSLEVVISLVPVMAGLVLCSSTELSFDTIGFLAAITNNCIDCVQNVFSKKLLQNALMTPTHLQFYTSVAAATLQLPILLYQFASAPKPDPSKATEAHSEWLYIAIFIDATFYHFQSVTAYYTMSLISPVTQSVANTVKRSILIFLSILYFHNNVTRYNIFGMVAVMLGIAAYNYARTNYPAEPKPTLPTNSKREEDVGKEEKKLRIEINDTNIDSISKPPGRSPTMQLRKTKTVAAPAAVATKNNKNVATANTSSNSRRRPQSNGVDNGKPQYLGGNVLLV